jgi:hypothetical protein
MASLAEPRVIDISDDLIRNYQVKILKSLALLTSKSKTKYHEVLLSAQLEQLYIIYCTVPAEQTIVYSLWTSTRRQNFSYQALDTMFNYQARWKVLAQRAYPLPEIRTGATS